MMTRPSNQYKTARKLDHLRDVVAVLLAQVLLGGLGLHRPGFDNVQIRELAVFLAVLAPVLDALIDLFVVKNCSGRAAKVLARLVLLRLGLWLRQLALP